MKGEGLLFSLKFNIFKKNCGFLLNTGIKNMIHSIKNFMKIKVGQAWPFETSRRKDLPEDRDFKNVQRSNQLNENILSVL